MKIVAKIIFGVILLTGVSIAEKAEEPADNAGSWTITPSRYLGESVGDFAQAMQARLAMAGRDAGPFGLSQDPNKEKVIVKVTGPRKRVKKVVTPFADVVNSIRISTVNIQEKTFLVGIETYRQGQEFAIDVRDQRMAVRIDVVRSDAITFTNVKSGETLTRQLDLIRGVTVGNGPMSVPGVTPAGGGAQKVMRINLDGPPLPQ